LTDAATLNGNALIANGQTIMLMDTAGNATWTTIQSGAGTGTLTLAATSNTARVYYTIVTATGNLVSAAVARSANAGEYVAIDVDEDGFPVVVYYNTAAQTLRLARANKVNPTAPADWTRQNVFAGGDPNAQFSGQHRGHQVRHRRWPARGLLSLVFGGLAVPVCARCGRDKLRVPEQRRGGLCGCGRNLAGYHAEWHHGVCLLSEQLDGGALSRA